MADVPNEPISSSGTKSRPLTELFHRINRVLPPDQEVCTLSPRTPVREALRIMRDKGFSQMPVVECGDVLGLFSYRSFASEAMKTDAKKHSLPDLPVDECMEPIGSTTFARVTDEFRWVFEQLDAGDAVLIGDPSRLVGILTPMDVLRYLYGVASPLVLIAEIEIAVRALISLAVDGQMLRECVVNSLSQHYKPDDLPAKVDAMTFNDYVQVIGDGRNWDLFQPVFGGTRERTRAKLKEIGTLRNDVFHFKREVTDADRQTLTGYRDWVLTKARAAEASGRGGPSNG